MHHLECYNYLLTDRLAPICIVHHIGGTLSQGSHQAWQNAMLTDNFDHPKCGCMKSYTEYPVNMTLYVRPCVLTGCV